MAKPGLLSFIVRRTMQDTAVEKFGKRETKPLETNIGRRPARSVVEFLRRNRSAMAAYRRISRNAGKRLVNRVQRRQFQLDLIDTRLMVSSWRSKLVDTTGTGLEADVQLFNEVPYTGYAHPKGTPSRRTFVRIDLPPIVRDIQHELAVDQAEYIGGLAAAIAADAARSALIDLTVGG